MLLIIFLVVFCSSRTILSQSMSVYGCRELRNVTFLGYFSNLFPPLEEHNPCINYHIYDPYTRKVVPANREAMERISVVPFSFGFDMFFMQFNWYWMKATPQAMTIDKPSYMLIISATISWLLNTWNNYRTREDGT